MTSGIQPQGATNNGNLFIPNKSSMQQFDSLKYGTDMRAIERWCNSLIAGEGGPEVILFQEQYTENSTGGSSVAINQSGLTILDSGTFQANFTPTSTKIKIRTSLYLSFRTVDNSEVSAITLAFVDTATGLIQESPSEVMRGLTPATTREDFCEGRETYETLVTGLTAGSAQAWSLAAFASPNSTSPEVGLDDGSFGGSNSFGPLVVTVYAA